MCKKCVEYKSFDELPEELKEKCYGRTNFIHSGFIGAFF